MISRNKIGFCCECSCHEHQTSTALKSYKSDQIFMQPESKPNAGHELDFMEAIDSFYPSESQQKMLFDGKDVKDQKERTHETKNGGFKCIRLTNKIIRSQKAKENVDSVKDRKKETSSKPKPLEIRKISVNSSGEKRNIQCLSSSLKKNGSQKQNNSSKDKKNGKENKKVKTIIKWKNQSESQLKKEALSPKQNFKSYTKTTFRENSHESKTNRRIAFEVQHKNQQKINRNVENKETFPYSLKKRISMIISQNLNDESLMKELNNKMKIQQEERGLAYMESYNEELNLDGSSKEVEHWLGDNQFLGAEFRNRGQRNRKQNDLLA